PLASLTAVRAARKPTSDTRPGRKARALVGMRRLPCMVQAMNEKLHSLGPYRLIETLGRGGMGVVYRAEHLQSGQSVALKTVQAPDEWTLSSLRREIHALARIRHPQIVRILDQGVEQGLPWYAMELLEGTSLRRLACDRFGGGREPTPERSAPSLAPDPL